jgi:hypothetical protein
MTEIERLIQNYRDAVKNTTLAYVTGPQSIYKEQRLIEEQEARDVLVAVIARDLEAVCATLEAAIVEGYPTPANKRDQCEHGRFGWEDCITCYDNALQAAIDKSRATLPLPSDQGIGR